MNNYFPSVATSLIFIVILCFLQLEKISSLTALQYGNEIRDIYAKDDACSTTETSKWTASALWASSIKTTCQTGYPIVGGYGVLGPASPPGLYYYRTYSSLPAHTYIYFTLTVWAIDSLDDPRSGNAVQDLIAFGFDSTTFTGFDWSTFRMYQYMCGSASFPDLRNNRIFGRVAHSASTLTVKIIDNADQITTDESFGFRELNLLFVTASSTNSICTVTQITPYNGGTCSCPEGQYLSGSTCVACDSLCASCFAAGASSCYQCAVGASWISGQCTSCVSGCAMCSGPGVSECSECLTGYYLFNPLVTEDKFSCESFLTECLKFDAFFKKKRTNINNSHSQGINGNTCVPSCEPPLTIGSDSNCRTTCSSNCGTTSFVYWDGSCNSTCAAPLTQSIPAPGLQLCDYPCNTTDYLYWDGTCESKCYEPLLSGVYLEKNFCYYTCSSTQYLYWNGTCSNMCLSPFQVSTSHGRMYCNRPCAEGEYLYWNGTCSASCPSPLTARNTDGDLYCDYGCASNQILYWDGSCEYTCDTTLLTLRTEGTVRARKYCDYDYSITYYLYANGSSLPTCDYPFAARVFKGRNFCDNTCNSTYYLYWNNSCLDSCNSPFISSTIAGIQYCDFPCPQNEFYYWDGVCDTTCSGLLIQEEIGGSSPRYYCNYPCSSTQFLYWNNTCLDSCDSPFTQTSTHGRKFCHAPCDYTEYIYFNGSCGSNCPQPFIPRKQAGLKYCDYQSCLSTEYVAAWTYECIADCSSPLRIVAGDSGIQWCLLPCEDPLQFYYKSTGECKSSCDEVAIVKDSIYPQCQASGVSPTIDLSDLILAAPSAPNAMSLVSFNKLSQSVKFVNFDDAPDRLQDFILATSRNVFSFEVGLGMPQDLKNKFVQRELATVFSRHDMPSSFIVNAWGHLIYICLFIVVGFLCKALQKVSKITQWQRAEPVLTKLQTIFLWNLALGLVGFFADDFILYLYLDISSMNLDRTIETINLFVGCFVLLATIALVIFTFYIVHVVYSAPTSPIAETPEKPEKPESVKEAPPQFNKKWHADFQVLFRDYQDREWRQRNFYAIYVLRMVIPMFVTVVFNKVPIFQTVFQTIINFLILIYLVFDSPLKKQINQAQILCYEFGALVINISAMFLTLVTANSNIAITHFRIILGDLIIFGNVYLNIIPLAFMAAKFYIELKYLYKYYRYKADSDPGAWVRLIIIPLQQAAFGFEELLQDKPELTFTNLPSKKKHTLKTKKTQRSISKVVPISIDIDEPADNKSVSPNQTDIFTSSRVFLNHSDLATPTPMENPKEVRMTALQRLKSMKASAPDSPIIEVNADANKGEKLSANETNDDNDDKTVQERSPGTRSQVSSLASRIFANLQKNKGLTPLKDEARGLTPNSDAASNSPLSGTSGSNVRRRLKQISPGALNDEN